MSAITGFLGIPADRTDFVILFCAVAGLCLLSLLVTVIPACRKRRSATTWGLIFFVSLVVSVIIVFVCRFNDTPSAAEIEARKAAEATSEDSEVAFPDEFVSACGEVGIDTSLIGGWEQIDDWTNGERYRFTYKRHPFYAYMNYDGTVNSILIGSTIGTAVYLQGYVPYNVEDYLVDEDTATALIPYAEDTVKMALNYPATADFPLLDWMYGREKDLYQLQSTVTAKNGFGVEEEMPFTVIFDLSTEGKAKCVYLELNGSVISSEMPEKAEREAVAIPEKSADTAAGAIRLVDGELGEYGRQDPTYPEYVDYYIPEGRYSVSGNAKNSIVMIIDNSTNDEVSRLALAAEQSGEIEITSNQHIELTIYSDVTLTEIQ